MNDITKRFIKICDLSSDFFAARDHPMGSNEWGTKKNAVVTLTNFS